MFKSHSIHFRKIESTFDRRKKKHDRTIEEIGQYKN